MSNVTSREPSTTSTRSSKLSQDGFGAIKKKMFYPVQTSSSSPSLIVTYSPPLQVQSVPPQQTSLHYLHPHHVHHPKLHKGGPRPDETKEFSNLTM